VYIDEEPAAIIKKFRSAQTDSGREIVRGEDKPGITNLIEILAIVRGTAPAAIEHDFEGKGYGDFKTAVGEEVAAWLAPVRERYLELREDTATIEAIFETGAAKAEAIAAPVLADVRDAMGVGKPVRSAT
jgi:tryptophanyl-tRNA synthetase